MKITPILIACLTFISCKEKNKSIYEGCCGTEATLDTTLITVTLYGPNGTMFDSTIHTNVYIPNIIVLDTSIFSNDDRLTLWHGNTVQKILSAVYSSEDGTILFSRENFLPNEPSHGWGGLKPDGTYHQGVFNYEITVAFLGGQTTKTYTGRACAYRCGDDGFPNEQLPACFFSFQHNGNGGYDPNLSYPVECF